jgi:hypothetical protein
MSLMEIGSIFLILALLIVVGLFVGRPILERRQNNLATTVRDDHERSSLLAERDRLINALQELDFDFALGKIPEEDYPQHREQLVKKGAAVLRMLDAFHPAPVSDPIEDRLEAAIAARREETAGSVPAAAGNGRTHGRTASVVVATPDDHLEVMLANRRRDRQDKAVGFCPKCGGSLQKSDLFCPKCGTKTI